MNSVDLSVQQVIRATCVRCGKTRRFEMAAGDSGGATAAFDCATCSHQIRVVLDPE